AHAGWKWFASIALGAGCFAAQALAAPPAVGTAFQSVRISGQKLGSAYTPGGASLEYTIAFDPLSGVYHLWCFTGMTVDKLATILHATSPDGIDFSPTGNLSYATSPDFVAYGAAGEPDYQFPRAARSGGDWKLLLWTPNAQTSPSPYGMYNYNESADDLGASPGNLAVTHQGPVLGGTLGQTTGWYGLLGGSLFAQYDNVGGIGRFTYTNGAPPTVPVGPPNATKDLITGTGYVYGLLDPSNPLAVYPHNSARTIDLGGRLGTFYSVRHWSDGSRVNKQIYYVESTDGGATWTDPTGLFANGDAVKVDGVPNTGNFSLPEVTMGRTGMVFYFSTTDSQGNVVVATNANAGPGSAGPVPVLGTPAIMVMTLALGVIALLVLRRLPA
ncbi:MAG: hypothetical protein L3J73_05640, partial [Thermoplasmata archaeon]|nr:hypothetical protein [Thermoplasmata archaeon]